MYAIDAAKPVLPSGLAIDVGATAEAISIEVVNTSSASARVIWERCAIIDASGRSQPVLVSGQKLIDAGKPAPPMIIASQSRASASVIPASNVQWVQRIYINQYSTPSGWSIADMFPTDARMLGGFAKADEIVRPLGGVNYRLLLYIERPDVAKPELQVQFTIRRIGRMTCKFVSGRADCQDMGEVYPDFVEPPPEPKRKNSSTEKKSDQDG